MRWIGTKPRFSVGRLMAALVTFAVCLAIARSLAPLFIPPITKIRNQIRFLDVKLPIGSDGREMRLTDQQWKVLLEQMISPPVLDAALSEPAIASLPRFQRASDPRAELRQMVSVSILFDYVLVSGNPSPLNMAELRIDSADFTPSDELRIITGAVGAAMEARYPGKVRVAGGPISLFIPYERVPGNPFDYPGRVAAATIVCLLVSLLTLFIRRKT